MVIKNLINHLKILTLSSNEISITEAPEILNSSWATCNESFSNNFKKLYLNLRLRNKSEDIYETLEESNQGTKNFTAYENFLKFLDGLEPKVVLEQIQIMIGCFEEFAFKPQILLQRLNKTLFNGGVEGLMARWGNCQR